ncbi:hypothetical protein F5Y01DRAFT_279646 [Xylaria sp. FL0043]|nr:hypothetical protein F5Y01DRAFT_279646 [Xylaria sp. FL0043]
MGRHEPLTSLALGRSPYDDVVEGEGEANTQEPTREYDEHGRVTNEASKRMNKDIIRAHNEVMLVIGVAEQEPAGSTSTAVDTTKVHNEYENSTGRHFLRVGRVLVVAGIWGVHGIRQRVLVYKETAGLPFLDMMRREGRTHTASQLFFAGMPSFLSAWSLQWYSRTSDLVRNHPWLRVVIGHIRFHLQIYVAMQRLDLIPGSRWFPSLNFFVPFSSASPFTAPPPLGSPGAQTLSEWAGKIAVSLAPYAGYYLIGCAWDVLSYFIRRQIHKSLPHPWPSSTSNLRALAPTNAPRRQSFPESPTLGDADREIRHTQGPELDGDAFAMNGEGSGEPLPVGTIRRQGTFSSRGGDDYATDEEDPEMVNPTLISFDVDTSESTEPPAGVWSAELRPSNSADPRTQEKEAPRYVVNTLTSLPSLLAGDILTSSLTHAFLTPFDILAFRAMARAFSLKFGLPVNHMFEVSLTHGLASRMVLNLLQTEVLKFLISFEAWAAVTAVAQRFHVTDEEWKEYQLGMERALEESFAEEQAQAPNTGQAS